jgi:hypothetical protein
MATDHPQYLSVIQHEVVKLLVLGSGGKLGVMPLRREDDFDLVVSIPEAGQSVIGLRIETASRLTSGPFGEWLVIESSMPPKHFQEDPRASYVFGHFSVEAMAFAGPLFVIPSTLIRPVPGIKGKSPRLSFRARTDAFNQEWSQFAFPPDQIGAYMLDMLRGQRVTKRKAA